ncbi:MAG TPA: hypothetical protein PLW93_05430 [Candidatus Absconditabacterales bacterium]|nr:hypothetical protein [Candidatus Absconditabacterales bacterium]
MWFSFDFQLFSRDQKSSGNNPNRYNKNQTIKQNIYKNSDQHSNDDHIEEKKRDNDG